MKTLITVLVGQPKNVGVVVAALLTAGQLRSEEYCAQAAECQGSPTAGPILSNSSTMSWRVSGGHSPSRTIDNRAALRRKSLTWCTERRAPSLAQSRGRRCHNTISSGCQSPVISNLLCGSGPASISSGKRRVVTVPELSVRSHSQ